MAEVIRLTPSQGGPVPAAIARASARTGIDFGYLLNKARIESDLDPHARAGTSSATGLFQFTEQTWLRSVKAHGGEFGLEWAAHQITVGQNGHHFVRDPDTRQAILDLRLNADAASAMAGTLAADNRRLLEAGLGHEVETVDMYLAHFLGAEGALKFLRAHEDDPNQAAAPLFPQAAAANRPIFYDEAGAPRSLRDIRDRFAAKLGASSGLPNSFAVSAEPHQVATAHRLQMAPFIPMPGKLSIDFAQAAYGRLAKMGGLS